MTNTENNTNAKMLERVRALLAKANDPSIGPDEADLLRGKADEMMTKHAISMWHVEQAQKGVNANAKPEQREVDFAWYYGDSVINEALWAMMQNVAHHCRVVLGVRAHNEGVGGYRAMPVFGLPSDIDYFDMMFTDLMLQLGLRLTPRVDQGKGWVENLVVLKESGMNWKPIAEALLAAGQLEGVATEWSRSLGVKFTKTYADYCLEHGREQLKVTPRVFQRSFAEGYSVEIRSRLRKMRDDQERSDSTGSMALAVIDIREQATQLYNELYPRTYANVGHGVEKTRVTDPGAMRRGTAAGREANLGNHHGRRVGGQGALNG